LVLDPRYRAFRRHFGKKFPLISLFQTFYLQAALNWLVGLPLYFAMKSRTSKFTIYDTIGAWCWLVGFAFEAISDTHLALFKTNPKNKGKLLTSGLWALSRHPNYFGNALLFFGLYFFALSSPKMRQGVGLSLILSPTLLTFLLMRVSGVTLLEKSMRKREGYGRYQMTTSAFFPLPPLLWFKRKGE